MRQNPRSQGSFTVAAVSRPRGKDAPPAVGRLRLHGASSAFTLLEVMLAMALLVLLSGALFGVMQASNSATLEMGAALQRQERLTALREALQDMFRSLPPDATMQYGISNVAGSNVPRLFFRDAPELMNWGGGAEFYGETSLNQVKRPDGMFGIDLVNQPEISQETGRPMGENMTLPLLSEIKTMKWRFYEQGSAQWMETWDNGLVRPAMVELQLQMAGETDPEIMVFWIPPVIRTVVQAPRAEQPTANPNPNPNPGPGGAPRPAPNSNGGTRP